MRPRHAVLAVAVAVLVAVAAAVLVAVDAWAVDVAEQEVVASTEANGGTGVDATVGGSPFLPQLLGRELDTVTVEADRLVGPDGQAVTEVSAVLTQVRLETSARAVAGRLTATVMVGYDVVAAGAGLPADSLSVGESGVRVETEVDVLGQATPVAADIDVAVDGDELVLVPTRVEIAGVTVDGAVEGALRDLLTYRTPVPELPVDVQVIDVHPLEAGILVDVAGSDVVLEDPTRDPDDEPVDLAFLVLALAVVALLGVGAVVAVAAHFLARSRRRARRRVVQLR